MGPINEGNFDPTCKVHGILSLDGTTRKGRRKNNSLPENSAVLEGLMHYVSVLKSVIRWKDQSRVTIMRNTSFSFNFITAFLYCRLIRRLCQDREKNFCIHVLHVFDYVSFWSIGTSKTSAINNCSSFLEKKSAGNHMLCFITVCQGSWKGYTSLFEAIGKFLWER